MIDLILLAWAGALAFLASRYVPDNSFSKALVYLVCCEFFTLCGLAMWTNLIESVTFNEQMTLLAGAEICFVLAFLRIKACRQSILATVAAVMLLGSIVLDSLMIPNYAIRTLVLTVIQIMQLWIATNVIMRFVGLRDLSNWGNARNQSV